MTDKLDGRNLYTATSSSFNVVAAALKDETQRPGVLAQLFVDKDDNVGYLKLFDKDGTYRIVKVKTEPESVQKNNG